MATSQSKNVRTEPTPFLEACKPALNPEPTVHFACSLVSHYGEICREQFVWSAAQRPNLIRSDGTSCVQCKH